MHNLLTSRHYLYEDGNSAATLREEKLPPIEVVYYSLHIVNPPLPTINLLKKFWPREGVKTGRIIINFTWQVVYWCCWILSTKTRTSLQRIWVGFWYYFSTSHLVMDLILKISYEGIGQIADVDQHLFVERSLWGGYDYNGDHILETDLTRQHTWKSRMRFFCIWNSFIRRQCFIILSHVEVPNCWTFLALQISTKLPLLRRIDPKDGFSKLTVKYRWNFITR